MDWKLQLDFFNTYKLNDAVGLEERRQKHTIGSLLPFIMHDHTIPIIRQKQPQLKLVDRIDCISHALIEVVS